MFNICSGGKEVTKKSRLLDINVEDIKPKLLFDTKTANATTTTAATGKLNFPPDGKTPVLLEIVGALGLEAVRGQKGSKFVPSAALSDTDVDPYCIVKVTNANPPSSNKKGGNDGKEEKPPSSPPKPKEVHRTKVIKDDSSPIWTVKTGSLCLLNLEPEQVVYVEVWCIWKLKHHLVGTVQLDQETLLKGDGNRKKHSILFQQQEDKEEDAREGEPISEGNANEEKKKLVSPTKKSKSKISLALRYRPATLQDYKFMNDIPETTSEPKGSPNSVVQQADDLDFKNITHKGILTKKTKTVTSTTTVPTTNGVEARSTTSGTAAGSDTDPNGTALVQVQTKKKLYRVWPCPDPDRPKETKFLSKEELQLECNKPSKQWVEAGSGDYGTVFLEILSCDNLPNMDTELVNGLTDAFCAIVFEDVFVRTSVIHDTLNPRWMPWSTRAFMFHITHPTSILSIGVLDYDEGPLKHDDPIGRVVLHLDEFEAGAMYSLSYPLYHGDTQSENHRGSIKLRFRVQRNSKSRVLPAPPRFIINTKSAGSWRTLRYITRGSVDMTDATVTSVKLYANELLDYWKKYCYLFDVAAGILLWRGRANVSLFGWSCSVWFPIHSVVLFAAVVVGLEFPRFLPSVIFYLLAYCLLAVNYYACNHPSPWRRVKPFFFRLGSSGLTIKPGTGVEGTETLYRLDTYKANRVTCFLYQFMKTGLNVYRVYSKNTPVDISTVSSSGNLLSNVYKDYLSYAHMMLRMLCRYIRLLRNFVNWKVPATHKLTATLLLWATVWCFFPYKDEAFFAFRILTYLCLGPWVKLLDTLWIHKYYRTTEDLLRDGIPETLEEMQADIMSRPNIMEPLLNSKLVKRWGQLGRIVQEDNLKLRDIREKRFGKWSELVPPYDASRFPSVPFEETSYAQRYATSVESAKEGDYIDLPRSELTVHYIAGQKLDGDMIPQPTVQPIHAALRASANGH